MDRVHPADESDLIWFWNESEGEISGMRSCQGGLERKLQVGLSAPESAAIAADMDERQLFAASRARDIATALERIGKDQAEVLVQVYRNPIELQLRAFGKAGNLARYTREAADLFFRSRSAMSFLQWLSRLAFREMHGKASEADRVAIQAIARGCESMLLNSWRAYAGAKTRRRRAA